MGPGPRHATACVDCEGPFITAFSFNSTNLFYQVIFLLSLLQLSFYNFSKMSSNIYSTKHTKKHSIIHVALSLFMLFTFFWQSTLNKSYLTGFMLVRFKL